MHWYTASMNAEVPQEKSSFQKMLDADPELRERYDAVVQQLRQAAEQELGSLLHYDFTTEDMREMRVASI